MNFFKLGGKIPIVNKNQEAIKKCDKFNCKNKKNNSVCEIYHKQTKNTKFTKCL